MFKRALFIGLLACGVSSQAATYNFTVTNGANMPLSPGVLYTSTNVEAEARIGSDPTAGFTKICQTGMNDERMNELKANPVVKNVMTTDGPILPGESRSFEVTLNEKDVQGLHFETMYGKTKDVCGVVSVNRHSLVALKQHVLAKVIQNDRVLLSGSFADPVTANASTQCAQATNGVECLRALSVAKPNQKVRAFSGYLPSVLNYLEEQYGSEDVLSLLVPTAGAIRVEVALKH
jgi:hypothetical protein